VAHTGHASIRFVAEDPPSNFAGILTSIPAAPYDGRRIRVSAQLRGAQLSGKGGVVWARADGATFAFATTQDTPLLGTTEWTPAEVTLDVPRGATSIAFGVYSNGKGTLWIDDVRIEADSVAPLQASFESPAEVRAPRVRLMARSPREAPRELSAHGLDNLTAFAKMLGYVRFFHPAPEAVHVNWDEFAVRGVRAVEGAPTLDSLAIVLGKLFAPVAPTVVVYRDGAAAPPAPSAPSPGAGVVYWQHLGVGTPSGGVVPASQSNIYASTRVLVPAAAVGAPVALLRGALVPGASPRIPDPAHPLQLPLGAGLRLSLPVALYSMEQVIPDSMQHASPALANERLIASDRATRLADVMLAWGVLQHFYPYHELERTDWPAALRTSLTRAATDVNEVKFQETLERMIASLHDGHGRVGSAYIETLVPDARLGWVEDKVVVVSVGDSAAAAGLKRGDIVLAVDGRPAEELVAATSERVSGATPQWVHNVALSRILAGMPRTSVALRVSGADGTPRELRLSRTTFQPARQQLPDKITELSPGTFYVDLGRITDQDFNAALPKLTSATGIVFDMRGYPSQVNMAMVLAHLTDTTIHSPRFESPLLTLPDRADMSFTIGGWTITPAAPRIKARIAFLSGGGSISYAESTLGTVEDNRLAAIVGEPSAGTNGNVNPFTLPGGYTISWTGMRVTKGDGSPHHGVGVVPTVPVSPTIAGIRAGRDEVLERAVQVVGGSIPRAATLLPM
ncbi:MAG: S41 family peptidase, partial [Gemmatimonadota bacterium]|nr:S41 family peptidase [Gemmatimonadota bacterium]